MKKKLVLLLAVILLLADVSTAFAYEGSKEETVAAAAVSTENVLCERKFDVTAGSVSIGKNVLLLRYGDGGSDAMDDVPAALYFEESGQYLTLSVSARKGDLVSKNAALTTDGAEQFVLIKADDWSDSRLSYYLYHPQTGLYIGLDEQNRLYACGKTKPEKAFLFRQTGYSDVGLLTTMDGYKKLSVAEQKRVLDVYGGVGARSLFRWGGTTDWSLHNALKDTAKNIYAAKDTTTADEQAAAMLDGMKIYIYHGQTNYYNLPELPGTLGLKTVMSEGTPGTYDFWSGTMLAGKQYKFSIIDDYGTHTMTVYIQDNSTAQTNANNLLEAIKQIPYPVRRNIRTIKVRNDSANSYNCGTNDLYMRLNWVSETNNIAQYLMHEFGHSMDFSYYVNSSGDWKNAINADVLKISEYGSTNEYEDFAEFGRLYFQMYGNYNAMYALRQLYPNRYRVYIKALESAQYEDIYEKYLYLPEQEADALYTGVIADFSFDDTESGLRSSGAVAKPAGNVVLDENGKSGKALKLDGTGSNFLKVWKNDNTSLLRGYDEFTVSYYSKPEKSNASWPVFLAPDENAQTYLSERYIGILDTAGNISVERYNNYGTRSKALKAQDLSNSAWRHVILVVERDKTILYVDGEKKAELSSDDAVQDILGKNGVFQIGKGNWNSGEYYQGLIDEMTVYGRALTEREVTAEGKKQMLAQFDFDDESSGFTGGGAKAEKNGTCSLGSDSISGKALSLSGSGYLNVTKEDGTALLTDCEEMTVSYYSKATAQNGQWTFFLAPDTTAQEYGSEKYIGVIDGNSSIKVERFYNNGSRPASISADHSKSGEWKHVIVVFEHGMTTLYVDGERVSYIRSDYTLPQITGKNSILQIGKGNWNTGEYFTGMIDEMTIWNSALTKEEVYDALENPQPQPADKSALSEALKNALPESDKDSYTEESWKIYAQALAAAEAVNKDADALQEDVDAAVKALTDALEALKEKEPDPDPDPTPDPDPDPTPDPDPDPTPDPDPDPDPTPVDNPYDDVKEGDWFYNEVLFAYENQLMTGKKERIFAPYENIARAQFAIILYRLEGSPEVTYDGAFGDVPAGEWFSDAITWAGQKGIVTGYTATGNFGPDNPITREELATMMYRYAKYKNYAADQTAELDQYEDHADIHEFALDAVKWAAGTGIIKGKYEETRIDPWGNTLRGETAIVLERFIKAYQE